MSIDDDKVKKFLMKSLCGFSQHGINHAKKVASRALDIAENSNYTLDLKIIEFASLFHDVLDKKNPNKITYGHVEDFLGEWVSKEEIKMIIEIGDNVSTTKEIKGLRLDIHEPYLSIVSAADKLEAIGLYGIERCTAFQSSKEKRNGRSDDQIFEYVFILFSTQYHSRFFRKMIRNLYAQKLADPLFEEQEKWLSENSERYCLLR